METRRQLKVTVPYRANIFQNFRHLFGLHSFPFMTRISARIAAQSLSPTSRIVKNAPTLLDLRRTGYAFRALLTPPGVKT
jgi:hypothetical protein